MVDQSVLLPGKPGIGFATGTRDVTPARTPVPLAGHGHDALAIAVGDPLEINAVYLHDGERRALLVTFDLLFMGGVLERDLRSELTRRHGLSDHEVLLFASHTHFAPQTDPSLPRLGLYDDDYRRLVFERALALAADIVDKPLRPLAIEIRQGALDHSVNRRHPRRLPTWTRKGGLSWDRVVMKPYPAGPRDETATIVTFIDAERGDALAMLWHYTCHPVAHRPGNVVSADYPGVARAELRDQQGRQLPVLFLQGFCGDVRPNLVLSKGKGFAECLRFRIMDALAGSAPHVATTESWSDWCESMKIRLRQIADHVPLACARPLRLASATRELLLASVFDGHSQRKRFRASILGIDKALECVALAAEPSVGWTADLGAQDPQGCPFRLFTGYAGEVLGYLPLPSQLRELGYEVDRFQPLFGMQGHFRGRALSIEIPKLVADLRRTMAAHLED